MPEDYVIGLQLDEGGVHEFQFIGGPIEDPERYKRLFVAIGHAAMSWARMEQHIDAILVQINKAQHSGETLDLYDPDHPKPFSDKIRMLKDYFNKHPALRPHTEAVRDFATGLMTLSTERNELLHGVLADYAIDTLTIRLDRIQYRRKTDDFLFRTHAYPLGRLQAFTHLVNLAHYGLCEISKELFTTDALERLRTP
jgi:hypothetical protein